MAKIDDEKDEILELIWTGKEKGSVLKNELIKSEDPKVSEEILLNMIDENLLIEKEGEIDFSNEGRERATWLIRSHRLFERLFTDVLDMEEEFLEPTVCKLEHVISPEVSESICTLLGHPKECPHGRPIPPGECCKEGVEEVKKIVVPLSELKSGERAKICYVATKHHSRLDHLTNLGLSPGSEISVHQTFPSYMIKVGETDIAIGDEILEDVYVRKK